MSQKIVRLIEQAIRTERKQLFRQSIEDVCMACLMPK